MSTETNIAWKKIYTKIQKSKEKFENKCLEDEKYCIIRDHWYYAVEYRGTVHSCA